MPSKRAQQNKLLQSLNLFGLDHLDTVILAALTDERPMLLVGNHGTAKSEMLNRIALSLELEHRHYNASLISFDDLIGYPVPNEDKTALRYLHTPGDIWSAESVFLDEISRCKPEHQNRLFSIVHEKRIQGIALSALRYRWSAMNPPPPVDFDEEAEQYLGSLPLDTALADRFAYIVHIPALEKIDLHERLRIIREGGDFNPDNQLKELVATAREKLKNFTAGDRQWASTYVNALVIPLKEAGLGISGRRAVTLASTVLSVQAAQQALRIRSKLSDSALIALRWGLPQTAQGINIRESIIHQIHKGSVKAANTPQSGFWQAVRNEINPLYRVRLALDASLLECNRLDFSQIVSDAWSGLSRPEQYLFSRNLLPALKEDRLNANTLELLLEPLDRVAQFAGGFAKTFNKSRQKAGEWDALQKTILKLKDSGDADRLSFGNLLYTLFLVEEETFDPAELMALDQEWHALFQGDQARRKSA